MISNYTILKEEANLFIEETDLYNTYLIIKSRNSDLRGKMLDSHEVSQLLLNENKVAVAYANGTFEYNFNPMKLS